METQKLIDFIPTVLLLVSVMTLVLVVLIKFGNKIIDNRFKANNVLIFVASFLFILILITHLFQEQSWTADTLKVIIGVLSVPAHRNWQNPKKTKEQLWKFQEIK